MERTPTQQQRPSDASSSIRIQRRLSVAPPLPAVTALDTTSSDGLHRQRHWLPLQPFSTLETARRNCGRRVATSGSSAASAIGIADKMDGLGRDTRRSESERTEQQSQCSAVWGAKSQEGKELREPRCSADCGSSRAGRVDQRRSGGNDEPRHAKAERKWSGLRVDSQQTAEAYRRTCDDCDSAFSRRCFR